MNNVLAAIIFPVEWSWCKFNENLIMFQVFQNLVSVLYLCLSQTPSTVSSFLKLKVLPGGSEVI